MTTDIVPTMQLEQPSNDLTLSNDNLLWIAEQSEKRSAAVNVIMKNAIKITTVKDWVNIGGNPYLMETGASKIARLFNMSWQIAPPRKVYDTDNSGHYSYVTSGTFYFAGAEVTAEGLRSTKDKFFSGSKGDVKPQDIDERNVLQASFTNCLNNGIKRAIPGLRGLTTENLREAGFDISQIKGYDFNTSQGKEMSQEAQGQRAEIEQMLKEAYGDKWKKALQKETSFIGKNGEEVSGVEEISKLSEKRVQINYPKIKKKYEMWVKERGRTDNSSEATGIDSIEDQNLPM